MKNKISKKLLSFMLTIAMVLSMIPFSSIPLANAQSLNLSSFSTNSNLKVYAYYTGDPTNRWKSKADPNIEYVSSATDTQGPTGTIWYSTSSYLNRVCNGNQVDYYLPYYTVDMKARTTTIVLDLGAWYNINSVKIQYLLGNNNNFSRLIQYPSTVYYSSASTIEEVRDYGYKSFYGTSNDATPVASDVPNGSGTTKVTAVTMTKSASKVRFVAIDSSVLTQYKEGEWQTGPKITEITVTGDDTEGALSELDYSAVTGVSVANVPANFNLGENVYKALETSGAVIKDQSGNTLTSVCKFEGLNTTTPGTRTAVAWVGAEKTSLEVPAARKATFNYTVNATLNNVSLNQTSSSGAMEPQMGLYGGANSAYPFAIFTGYGLTGTYANSTNVKVTTPVNAADLTTYYPFTPQALSEHLESTKALAYGVSDGYANTSVINSVSGGNTNGTSGNYAIIDLQKDYNIKMVQFTAAQNVNNPKLYYLTEAEGANIITGAGQKVVGRSSSAPASAPFAEPKETFNVDLLGTEVAMADSTTTTPSVSDTQDYGSFNSKDTVVAFKSDASQTPALSGALSTSVNATPVVVTNPAVAATARYVIIQNQTTNANTTQVGEFKIWADTVQAKIGVKIKLNDLISFVNAKKAFAKPALDTTTLNGLLNAATTVNTTNNATQEQVDVAFYNLFNLVKGSTFTSPDKPTLLSVINEAKAKIEADYTPNSWTAAGLAAKIAAAQAVYDDSNATPEQIGAQITTLTDAMALLVKKADKTALNAAIATANSKVETDYTPLTWTPFATAKSTANTVAADANATQTAVDNATTALTSATSGLVARANITALNAAIATANSKVETDYTPNSWTAANLKGVTGEIAKAQAVASNLNATQTQVDDAKAALEAAMAKLVLRADFTALNAAITKAKGKIQADFTPESWTAANLSVEIPKAETVASNFNATQAEVDSATTTLNAAMALLVVKPTDKTALKTAIDTASTKSETDYTPISWTPFATALTKANSVYADVNAGQSEIDNAKTALTSATSGLVARANFTALNAAITTALTKVQADYTTASWATFATALATAQSVVANLNATQAQVDSATTALVTATNALVKKPKYMLGDVNNDAKIDGKDIAAIVMHITKVKVLTNPTDLYPALTAADINGDAKVDGKDIAAIVMHITKVKLIVQPV